MKIEIPEVVKAYITASNHKDIPTVITLFTKNALVKDEGSSYNGLKEIVGWQTKVHQAYNFQMEAIKVADMPDGCIVTTTLSGNFPGKNPVDVEQHFIIKDGLIASLTIK